MYVLRFQGDAGTQESEVVAQIRVGFRHSDIKPLKWKQIQQTSKGTWQAVVVQQKTKKLDCKPVTAQALQLCGERPDGDERLVFEGLTDIS